MRPNRLELCATWEFLPATATLTRKPSTGSREPCYATGKEGLHEIQVDLLDFGDPRMERERSYVEHLMATKDVGDSQMPPIVTFSQKRSNTCIRGFLRCVALQQIPSHRSPFQSGDRL